jgi:uncharacterized protein (DUF1778 family)
MDRKIRAADRDVSGKAGVTTFNARLPKPIKYTLQRAADLRGQTLSEFVLASAYDRAVETISSETVLRLSERDSEAFARAILEPDPVNEATLSRFLEAHVRSQR